MEPRSPFGSHLEKVHSPICCAGRSAPPACGLQSINELNHTCSVHADVPPKFHLADWAKGCDGLQRPEVTRGQLEGLKRSIRPSAEPLPERIQEEA